MYLDPEKDRSTRNEEKNRGKLGLSRSGANKIELSSFTDDLALNQHKVTPAVQMPPDKVICKECGILSRWTVYYFSDGTSKCLSCLRKKFVRNGMIRPEINENAKP